MSAYGYNPVVEDMRVAVQADLHDLADRRPGEGLGGGESSAAPASAPALRPMRCAYPRCASEATLRCAGCRRIYCAEHCRGLWLWSPEARPECALCARHLPRDADDAPSDYPTAVSVGAVIVFLLAVSLGVAIDVSARADGRIALWVFGGAFLVFAHHMDRA